MKKEMLNFEYYNPTRIVFGKDNYQRIGELIPKDKKVLITYGKGSVIKNGTLAKVQESLKDHKYGEFSGIEPNPKYETLMKAVEMCQKEGYDYLLAVGGGSIIDGTKFIAAAALCPEEPYQMFGGNVGKNLPIKEALPLASVLTIPATGSEMNSGGVVTFVEKKAKLGFGSPLLFPQFSLLDPEVTYSLPHRQLINSIIDSFVHVTEQYLTYPVNAMVQDRWAESLLKTLIEIGPDVVDENNHDYNTRANLMWTATNALNGSIRVGVPEDWATHMLGHEITNLYGLDHGVTLAIILPTLLEVRKDAKHDKLVQYAENVWDLKDGTDDAKIEQAIQKTREFFESLGAKTHLSDYDLTSDDVQKLTDSLESHGMSALGEDAKQDIAMSKEIYTKSL